MATRSQRNDEPKRHQRTTHTDQRQNSAGTPSGVAVRLAVATGELAKLQRLAGNAAVAQFLQRCGPPTTAPPRRPPAKPKASAGAASAKPMRLPAIYSAIMLMQYDLPTPKDYASLDKSELRTLDTLLERTIERAEEIAAQQAKNFDYSPPGLPDLVYKNVAEELRKLRKSQIQARQPYAAISALVSLEQLARTEVGSNSTSQQLWSISTRKVRELLWREELGSVNPFIGYDEAFNDTEVLTYGYVDRYVTDSIVNPDPGVWGIITKPPLTGEPNELMRTSVIVQAIRDRRTLVPLELAKTLLNYSEAETTSELLGRLTQKVDEIDLRITRSLQLIHNGQVGHTPFGGGITHESAFLRWLEKQGAKSGRVYSLYLDFVAGKKHFWN